MANRKSTQARVDAKPSATADLRQAAGDGQQDQPPGGSFLVFRETVESIVVAFVLAFLFRTFEAEAFVIPTGSMSPSLQGQHKDVECTHCGYSFRTTASSEGENRDKMIAQLGGIPRQLKQVDDALERNPRSDQLRGQRNYLLDAQQDLPIAIANSEVVGGMCPMCRYLMPMRPDLPGNVRGEIDVDEVEKQSSY